MSEEDPISMLDRDDLEIQGEKSPIPDNQMKEYWNYLGTVH